MFPWAFAASLERSFIVGDGQHCPQVPRNLRSQSACDSNVNSNRKWPVIHGRAPALWLSQLSVHHAHTHTRKQARTDADTHTHAHAHANTAGLPVSADLGGASETLHAFHNHSSPTLPTSKLAPSSSSAFILFHLSRLPCLPFAFISGERASERELRSALHLFCGLLTSRVCEGQRKQMGLIGEDWIFFIFFF